MKKVELKKCEIDYRSISRPTALYVSSGHSEYHWMDEKYTFSKKFCSKFRKLNFETSKNELKSVCLEKKRFWESRWVEILGLYERLVILIPRFQCKITFDSVLTQYSSKSKDFLLTTFGGINLASSFGDIWVCLKRFLDRKGVLLPFSDYQDCGTRNKVNNDQIQ